MTWLLDSSKSGGECVSTRIMGSCLFRLGFACVYPYFCSHAVTQTPKEKVHGFTRAKNNVLIHVSIAICRLVNWALSRAIWVQSQEAPQYAPACIHLCYLTYVFGPQAPVVRLAWHCQNLDAPHNGIRNLVSHSGFLFHQGPQAARHVHRGSRKRTSGRCCDECARSALV